MYALNRAQVIGHLTETPQVREVGSGTFVTDLNVEVKIKNPNDSSEYPTIATFVTVTLWQRMAEIARDYLKEGGQVYVSGRLETDSWENEKGEKRFKTKIVGEDMILLSPKDTAPMELPSTLSIATGINKIELIGNTTKDLELKTTPNGSMVCNFGVATNRYWTSKDGEKQESATFHNVVAWDTIAEEAANHITRGQKVYISGRLQTRSWDGPDGTKRYSTEIVAEEIKALGITYDKKSSGGQTPETARAAQPQAMAEVPEINYESEIRPEDLPF